MSKRLRRQDTEIIVDDEEPAREQESLALERQETEGVIEVTQGVQEVELEDIKEESAAEAIAEAAAVPLPDSPVLEAQVDAVDEEVVAAEKKGPSRTARVALGFDEVLDDDLATMQKRPRNYARRQLTWMRKVPNLRWLDRTKATDSAVAAEILSDLADRIT